jgi:predicted DNA-binding transcriptional regulator AlpA
MSTVHSATTPEVTKTTPQDEIITVAEVAAILKCRPSSVYNLTRKRGLARYAHPLPVIRLPLGLRFKRSSILQWLDDIEERPKRAS